jgi:hypothetical protein
MKTCPVCNESFADELNFCDLDGVRLAREVSEQDRNKWWSLIGAGLLIGAVVITASMLFIPKTRVPAPVAAFEPQTSKAPSVPSATSSTAPLATAQPESDTPPADITTSELKKKDKSSANSNTREAAPNPKAAALAAEGDEKDATSTEVKKDSSPAPTKTETPPAAKGANTTKSADVTTKPAQPSSDLKKEQNARPAAAKTSEKASNTKKKSDDKDNKKGGFLRVFKKIFGKD